MYLSDVCVYTYITCAYVQTINEYLNLFLFGANKNDSKMNVFISSFSTFSFSIIIMLSNLSKKKNFFNNFFSFNFFDINYIMYNLYYNLYIIYAILDLIKKIKIQVKKILFQNFILKTNFQNRKTKSKFSKSKL